MKKNNDEEHRHPEEIFLSFSQKTYTVLAGVYRRLIRLPALRDPDQQSNNGYGIGCSLHRIRALRHLQNQSELFMVR
ncbi:MAG: hypothetical protein P8M70_11570 [Verrucomicrobiota bacterium]|nr:hypothetical protein [Verrucomicrobiota bacterium]